LDFYNKFKYVLPFKENNNGVIGGDFGAIYTTSNGGTTWTPINTFNGGNYPTFTGISFVPNSTNVWAVGYKSSNGFVAKSTDNGLTWSETTLGISSIPANTIFNNITFTSANNGFIVGDNSTIFKTTNGGLNWQLQLSPISSSLKDIQFVDNQTGFICGTFPNGSFLKTIDGGNTWKSSSLGSYPISLSFVDEYNGWLTNYGLVTKYTAPQCPTTPAVLVSNCCDGLQTLKSGSWTDPTTWSCNRVPTATDDVFINAGHTVTETSSSIIRAKTLTYRGGTLQIPQATTLRLGNQ
jgi:hypothetical protein